jgi:misacylated tRNA(Ala) deacylase
MTDLLYHSDSYLKEFEATVVNSDRELNAVILDRTAFYPGGGGQVPDAGFIRSGDSLYSLVRAKHSPEGIMHSLEPGQTLPAVGAQITGVIDWDRRYQVMRTHTAMHILCGVIFRDFKAHVTGGDMEPLNGRMDFEFESMSGELVGVINAAINKEVQAAREVRAKVLPRDEAFKIPDLIRTKINLLPEGIAEVRTIEIVGLDLQADGRTHVKNTSEVGVMHVTDYKSKGKINKRIYIELDQ